jgi:iron complex outermembrane receptor protein
MSTVIEGVPIWAIETPGPRVDMLDLENVASMTYYTGGVPPNLGLGGQDTAGAIDMRVIKPGDGFSVTANQSNGSWNFNRTFIRLDSGRLPTDTRFYASYSYTGDDKWKGLGSNYRHHGSLGVTQTFSPKVTAEVYADFNSELAYASKTLTYAQVQNLPANYKLDYNQTLTGNATTDANYYAFNNQRDRDFNLLGKLAIQLPGESVLTWKPYYWTEYQPAESSQTIPGTTLTGVRIRTNYFDRGGSVLEWSGRYRGTDILAGYWVETFNLPIGEKYYTVGGSGSLVFNRWALDQPDGRGLVNSPYLSFARSFFGNLHIALGFRYLDMQNPGQIGYITTATGDMSYQQALRNSQGVDAPASFVGKTQRVGLPNAGVSYRILSGFSIYANFGRNYARPQSYPELMQTFLSARAAYTAAGVNMQYLYDKFGLTRADDYETGLRYESRHFYVTPSVFYNRYYDKLLTVWDPIAGRTIRQAIGETRVRGFELEGGATPFRRLTLFSSFSYNSSELLSNLYTAANAFIAVAGKQTVDTPPYVYKGGLTYTLLGFAFAPTERYVSTRYGDTNNTQKVPSYAVTDLTVSYFLKESKLLRDVTAIKGLSLSVSALNLFNRKYVALIGAFEDAQSASYLVGPPRTCVGRIAVSF